MTAAEENQMSDPEARSWIWKIIVILSVVYLLLVFAHGRSALFFTAMILSIAVLGRFPLRELRKKQSALILYDITIIIVILWGIYVHVAVWVTSLREPYGAEEIMCGLGLQFPVLIGGWLLAFLTSRE